jgi:delta 1-pyrroline-5-carboxylate dehydrogenase
MTSDELMMQNARNRQQLVAKLSELNRAEMSEFHKRNAFLGTIACALLDAGHSISEQICELREAVDRLSDSLPKKSESEQ